MDMDTSQKLPTLQWSNKFAVLPASFATSKNLQGDKIILPQSALEQMLAASPLQRQLDGFTNTRSNGRGFSDDLRQLPNPLMFRLVNPTNKITVFAGIREFSSPEGTIGLSPLLLEALGIPVPANKDLTGFESESGSTAVEVEQSDVSPSSIHLSVHSEQLPKGTYVRLRPLEAGYNPDDWKALLERHLRNNFTTLTLGATCSVNGVQGETFEFLIDKFLPEGDGICVVDTDLEVDIEPLNEEQARETLRQLNRQERSDTTSGGETTTGTSQGGLVDIWKSVSGQVVCGEYVDYLLPSWNRSQPLRITLSGLEKEDHDSLDLFVTPKSSRQRALPRNTEHVFGDFSPARNGTKSISISPTNFDMGDAESIAISVHAYLDPAYTATKQPGPITFTLRAEATTGDENGVGPSEGDSQSHSSQDEQCTNCLQWVPRQTIRLHQNFCLRNNIVCQTCKFVFKKGSLEWDNHWHCDHDDAHGNSLRSKAKHHHVFHSLQKCSSCEFSSNSLSDLARHRTSVCPGKIILCRFCHLEVPQEGDPFNPAPEVVLSGMTAHELADGSRTTECHMCEKIIRLRDMEMHLKHHELDKVSRPKPSVCRNTQCGRTMYGVGPKGQIGTSPGSEHNNDLGLCSICFGPMYVSAYDPEGKALKRRIERRYLGQLMTGCGKPHCGNDWCKTGRAHNSLEPFGTSTSAILPLVKPLLTNVLDKGVSMFFCVDESSQSRKKLAEMMAGEHVWELEWCVAAVEAEKGNLNKAREWLVDWAPRR